MIETFPTLYKRTSTGAIQIWFQEIDGNGYRTTSGQIDGAKVTSEWTRCEGKNQGRANATTPEQQARSEVDSNYTKKLAQGGYHESLDDIDKPKFFKPMLAKGHEDYEITQKEFDKGVVYSQPKLDGVRCIVTHDGMWSRSGKPLLGAPHIRESLNPLFERHPDLILDGELYADKFKDDFNTIISIVRKLTPEVNDLELSRESIQYWVYDLPSHEAGFGQRYQALFDTYELGHGLYQNTQSDYSLSTFPLILVDTVQVTSHEHLNQLNTEYVAAGMEGQIIRIDGTPYENKRTKQLRKRKEFIDEEFPILRIEEGVGNRSGMAGRIVYALPDGREFASNIRGGVEFYRMLLDESESYVGGTGTVRYFNRTPDGIPRFPVTVAVYKGKRDL